MSNKNIELLNKETIFSAIEPKNINRLAEMEIFDSIDSTNSYLLMKGKQGAVSGTVCLAEHQTAGRGRQGKSWVSVPGSNVYCSLLWRFKKASHLSSLSIAVGVMVAETLRKYGVISGISLKWPNDILFEGRKLAGILLESNETGVVVMGIGLNLEKSEVNCNPSKKNLRWAAVEEILPIRRNYFIGLLLNELLEKIPLYEKTGLEFFFPVWEKYDGLKNQIVRMMTSQEIVTGIARGIDREGKLLVEERDGRLRGFCYGEISVEFAQKKPATKMGN